MILGASKEIPPKNHDFEPDVNDIRLNNPLPPAHHFCVWQKLQNDQFQPAAAGHCPVGGFKKWF